MHSPIGRAAAAFTLVGLLVSCGTAEQRSTPAPASSEASPSEGPPSPVATSSAEMTTVLNDIDTRIAMLCAACGPEGHVLDPQQRVTFDRAGSHMLTFRRSDGTATCVLFGQPAGDQSQTPPAGGNGSESQPIGVSSGGDC